jgi:cell wall assembly regulator SMI1
MLTRVRRELARVAPLIEELLLPPSHPKKLEELQSLFDISLPHDLIELYRSSAGLPSESVANFAFGMSFLDIDSVISNTKSVKSDTDGFPLIFADQGIRKDFIHGKLRLEIGNDSEHCQICVDLSPDSSGQYGQVIFVDEECRISLVLARNLIDFMIQFANDLSENKYSLNEEALADGHQFLEPAPEIDVVNWHNSPIWRYIRKS